MEDNKTNLNNEENNNLTNNENNFPSYKNLKENVEAANIENSDDSTNLNTENNIKTFNNLKENIDNTNVENNDISTNFDTENNINNFNNLKENVEVTNVENNDISTNLNTENENNIENLESINDSLVTTEINVNDDSNNDNDFSISNETYMKELEKIENEKNVLKKKLKKSKVKNILFSIYFFISLLIFIFIAFIVYLFYGNLKKLFPSFLNSETIVASSSQMTHKQSIDYESFIKKLTFVDDIINNFYYYEKDNDKIMDGMFQGYMSALGDQYAEYFPKQDFEEFTEITTYGEYYGIGCLVNQDLTTYDCIINKIYKNSPAEIGGLKKGDIFVAIDGEEVRGKKIDYIVGKIKGPEGTQRNIKVYRPSEEKDVEVVCYCGKVDIELISSEIYEDNIGYVDIDEFTGKASPQFKEKIDELLAQNIDALILDCRSNAGGELMTILEMLDYLVKDNDGKYTLNQKENIFDPGRSLLVYIKEKDKIVDAAYGSDNHSVELPMIVLTDFGTASAAELFTKALNDYDKAEIVGTRTFGKGVVQNIIPYDDGSAIKFTVSEYFPPSGYNINKKGILPNYSLSYSGEEVFYDENNNIVIYDENYKIIMEPNGTILEEIPLNISTNSNIISSSSNAINSATVSTTSITNEINENTDSSTNHYEDNLKIYDFNNNFITEDWYLDLYDKYDDKQLLQAIIILKSKLNNK